MLFPEPSGGKSYALNSNLRVPRSNSKALGSSCLGGSREAKSISKPSKNSNKPTRGRVYPPPSPSQTVRTGWLELFPRILVAALTLKETCKNQWFYPSHLPSQAFRRRIGSDKPLKSPHLLKITAK